MRRSLPILIALPVALLLMSACGSAAVVAADLTAALTVTASPMPTITASATPTATATPIPTATPTPTITPTPTPWYDAALVERSYMSTTYGNRLWHPVELVYYQACQDIGLRCEGDCTEQVLLSIPTDTVRGLVYTANYPQIDLVVLDAAIPVVPSMSPDYVPMLNARAAEALLQLVTYVRETTGRQIYVMHTYRPFFGGDPLGAGASQHQSGLAADLYLSDDGGQTLLSIMSLEGIYEIANRFGWVRAFDFEDPHFFYLDGPAPGLTMALINRGVRLNANQYAVTNALIAAYQTLTDTIPEEIRAQLEAGGDG